MACTLGFDLTDPAVLAFQIAVAAGHDLAHEQLDVTCEDSTIEVSEQVSLHGGRTHVVHAPAGRLRVGYAATTRAANPPPGSLDAGPAYDDEAIVALRQSRYCPSDALAGFAAVEFAGVEHGPLLAPAVASWVFERFAYQPGSSGPLDTAIDTLVANAGVCRDFAHVTIALCRGLGIPARLAAVYAPGLSPMDFHAVVEVRNGSRWEIVDPTRLAPRSSLVRIATGRDAADTAFATTLAGEAELISTEITAYVDGDLPADDHVASVILR
ncbi:MAG: transglutaminase-like domain-containing protein [Acidimicrobiales bacterium]